MKRVFVLLIALGLLICACAGAEEVKHAADWAETYPEVYASYMANSDKSVVADYVAQYPMIAKLYEGMAFNTYYDSARGHSYTLEDVAKTGRPHPLANCMTCKTPDYTALVNKMGVGAYSISFDEAMALAKDPISCYNCHANEVPNLVVTHQYLADAMEGQDVKAADLSCGQCHVEYYFAPETKATTLPYTGVETMTPDSILAFYNVKRFTDYTNPRTGTQQIKVQHPEFETFLGEGSAHKGMFTCADCHMGKVTSEAGVTYADHFLASPLEKPELVKNNCAACHSDLAGMVKDIQEKAEARTAEVGEKLVALTDELAAAVEAGKDEAFLNQVRSLNRNAQFYWDFVFVENSEGAHNSRLTHQCLDKAEALADAALALVRS